MKTKLPLYLALLLLTQCSKCKTDDPAPAAPNPVDMLPPATQTGQRTFGCLLNGQPWNPAGNPFAAPVFSAEYYQNRLGVSCRRAFNNSNGSVISNQSMEFAIDSVVGPKIYILDDATKYVLKYNDYVTNCQYATGNGMTATVELTRFDPVARIVSGTFFFTLEKPGCGRVVVTDGRFDSRF